MNKVFLFLVMIFSGFLNSLQAQYPTDSAKFFLITASPGEETYAIFGHSALRVYDPAQEYDVVFNWGTFDFSTKNFYLKFATGKLMYFLSLNNYEAFLNNYYGQAIYEQEITLTNLEKFKLINNLQINTQEENKYFRYDFFRDNCATRIRDMIEKSVEGKLVLDTNYVEKKESFRRLFGDYLENKPWTFFGLNLIMGKSTDSIASLHDYMYLPGHLQNLFESAKIVSNGETRNLTSKPIELFPSSIVVKEPSFVSSPVFICMLVFIIVLVLTLWEYRSRRHFKALDVSLFLLTGMLGLLITWLWGWSLHIYVHNNFHIVWASPLNFVAGVLLIFMPAASLIRYYFGLYAASVILMIAVSFFLVQEIQFASYFLMGIMITRAVRLFFIKK
jgi:hypothetical protein